MLRYGIIGKRGIVYCGNPDQKPKNGVLMDTDPPDGDHMATAEGTWVIDQNFINQRERVSAFTTDDIINTLKNAENQQIKDYIDNNVTSLTKAKKMIARIFIILAYLLNKSE